MVDNGVVGSIDAFETKFVMDCFKNLKPIESKYN